jgi:SAM-dependent methyltransferase
MTDRVALLSESWDEHAQEWIDWVRAPDCQDSYWRFHRKSFLSLIPELGPGQLIIDVGCGEGRVARDLQAIGHRVLGVDISHTMCRAVVTHPEDPAVVLEADAAKLPLADESADCVIAFMSLQDIDNMQDTVTEIARVLKDGASLALAILHPMYSAGSFSSPQGNDDGQFVLKPTYFVPERLVSTNSRDGRHVTFFREHRPLQAYINALIGAGLHVSEVLELSDEDATRHRNGIPMFLDIVATRQPRAPQEKPPVTQRKRRPTVISRRRPRRGYLRHRRPTGTPGRQLVSMQPLWLSFITRFFTGNS